MTVNCLIPVSVLKKKGEMCVKFCISIFSKFRDLNGQFQHFHEEKQYSPKISTYLKSYQISPKLDSWPNYTFFSNVEQFLYQNAEHYYLRNGISTVPNVHEIKEKI